MGNFDEISNAKSSNTFFVKTFRVGVIIILTIAAFACAGSLGTGLPTYAEFVAVWLGGLIALTPVLFILDIRTLVIDMHERILDLERRPLRFPDEGDEFNVHQVESPPRPSKLYRLPGVIKLLDVETTRWKAGIVQPIIADCSEGRIAICRLDDHPVGNDKLIWFISPDRSQSLVLHLRTLNNSAKWRDLIFRYRLGDDPFVEAHIKVGLMNAGWKNSSGFLRSKSLKDYTTQSQLEVLEKALIDSEPNCILTGRISGGTGSIRYKIDVKPWTINFDLGYYYNVSST